MATTTEPTPKKPEPRPVAPVVVAAVPRGLITTTQLIILAWGLATAGPFLIPLFIAALFAFSLAPIARALRRLRCPEWLAISLSAIVLAAPFVFLGYLLVLQGQALVADIPVLISAIRSALSRIAESSLGRNFNLSRHLNPAAVSERIGNFAGQGLQMAITGLRTVLSAGSQLALVLFFSILMLASRRHLRLSTERLLSRSPNHRSPTLIDEVTALVERFLLARLAIVIIIAAIDTGILSAFRLPYSALIGGILGVMTLIPAIGFLIGLAPAIAVSIAAGKPAWATLLMSGLLFMMSIVEGNVLTPKMVGNRLNINTLFTFLGIFAGGLLWGIWGMLLSIPILGIMRIAFSASPALQPWGELLAEREEDVKSLKLIHKQR